MALSAKALRASQFRAGHPIYKIIETGRFGWQYRGGYPDAATAVWSTAEKAERSRDTSRAAREYIEHAVSIEKPGGSACSEFLSMKVKP